MLTAVETHRVLVPGTYWYEIKACGRPLTNNGGVTGTEKLMMFETQKAWKQTPAGLDILHNRNPTGIYTGNWVRVLREYDVQQCTVCYQVSMIPWYPW